MRTRLHGNALIYFVIIILVIIGLSLIALSARMVMLSKETTSYRQAIKAEHSADVGMNDALLDLFSNYPEIQQYLDFNMPHISTKDGIFDGKGSYYTFKMPQGDDVLITSIGCYQAEACDEFQQGRVIRRKLIAVSEKNVAGRWGFQSTLVIRDGVITMNGSHLFNNLGRTNLVSIGADANGSTTFEACTADPSCPINPTGAVVIYGGDVVEFSQPLKQMNFEQIIQSSVGLSYADVVNSSLTSGTDVIYYNNNTTLNGAQSIGSSANPKIIVVDGDLTLNGSSQIYGYVIARGTVRLNGSSVINGAVISATIDATDEDSLRFNGSATLTSDTSYDNQFNLGEMQGQTSVQLIPVSGAGSVK